MSITDISKLSWNDYKKDTFASVISKGQKGKGKTMAAGLQKYIDIKKLRQHPKNVRKSYDGIEELAASVRENGILQNLTVVPDPATDGYYLVVIGNRRLLAAREAGLDKVPCRVEENMGEGEQIATMLLENMQRKNLNLIEESKGVQMTLDLGFDIDELSKKTGLSKKSLKERKKIADLDLDYSEVPEETMKQITIADMEKLAGVRDEEARQEILKTVGSDDFAYNITKQVNKERCELWKNCMKGLLKGKAEEVFQSLAYGEYEESDYYYESDREKKFPEFDDDHRYVYYFNNATMMILYSINKADDTAEADAELEEEDDSAYVKVLEERKQKQKRAEARSEEERTLLAMRKNYMMCKTEQKSLPYNRLLYWVTYCWVGSEDIDDELYAELIGKTEEELEVYDFNALDAARDAEFDPVNVIKLIYAALESRWHMSNLPCDFSGHFVDDFKAESWQTMYNFLEECGYKVSKREWAIVGGTSDLYEKDEEEDD